MSVALPLTTMISQTSTRKRTYRVLSAQFGDGYSQEAPDGINDVVDEWNLKYENLTTDERSTLMTALDSVGGYDYLTYAPPGDSLKRWKISKDGVSETPKSGDLWDISFTIKQWFGS